MNTVVHYFRTVLAYPNRLCFPASSTEITVHDAIRLCGLDDAEVEVSVISQPGDACQRYACRYPER